MTETVLFIDAAYDACSVGLLRPDGTFNHVHEPMKYGHAEALMPLIEGILSKSGISANELSGIAVNIGPGRFTGIRLGITAAKSLAMPFGTRLYGITGDAVYAYRAQEQDKKPVITVIDSGRGNYFCRVFDADGNPEGLNKDLTPDEVMELYRIQSQKCDCIFAGDATASIGVNADISPLNAEDMYSYWEYATAAGKEFNPVTPLYVRPPDACPAKK